jgi:alpha-1,3-rhamnosyl/mannosyltransferase
VNEGNAHGRLHVGVNLLWLVPGVVGGSEEYTTRLLQALADNRVLDIDVTLFVNRSLVDAYPDLVASFPTVVCPLSGQSKLLRIAAEATWLAGAARRRRVDLLHHAGGTLPVLRATPSLVTIHDLQPLLMPANFSAAKARYLRMRLRPSAHRSRLVVAQSDYTRRTIVGVLGVSFDRTAVVPPGYSEAIVQEPERDPRAEYRLDRSFFVYPAITYPHKNHLTLVRAFAGAVEKGLDALLVLTHRPDVVEDSMLALIDSLGIRDRVRRLGHVPRGDLDWMYRNALALTFPSRFEGFGLPVLEAMGNGCPVIAADATALPDVVGDAGVLVDPSDVPGWTAAMVNLAGDPARRAALAEAGLARARTFRWSSSAEALVAAYRLASRSAVR